MDERDPGHGSAVSKFFLKMAKFLTPEITDISIHCHCSATTTSVFHSLSYLPNSYWPPPIQTDASTWLEPFFAPPLKRVLFHKTVEINEPRKAPPKFSALAILRSHRLDNFGLPKMIALSTNGILLLVLKHIFYFGGMILHFVSCRVTISADICSRVEVFHDFPNSNISSVLG